MKTKLLSLAIISTLAATANASDVTVYGKVNLSYNKVEKDQAGITDRDNWDMESFASRIGFKGSEVINEDLTVIYKLEYQVVPDGQAAADKGTEFKARNSYVGFQGRLGTVIAGTHDTPMKMSQGKVDIFNDYSLGDIGLTIPGERRENDIVIYSAPKIGNLALNLGIMPGGDGICDQSDDPLCNDRGEDDGFADQISASAVWKKDNLYIAGAIDDNVNGMDILRLTGSIKLGDVTIGAMVQNAEDSDDNIGKGIADNVKGAIGDVLDDYESSFVAEEQDSYLLSVKWAINNLTLKAQYIDSTYESKTEEIDNSTITIGADYRFSKRTKIYTHFSELTVDKNENIGLTDDYEYTATGLVGIEHKF